MSISSSIFSEADIEQIQLTSDYIEPEARIEPPPAKKPEPKPEEDPYEEPENSMECFLPHNVAKKIIVDGRGYPRFYQPEEDGSRYPVKVTHDDGLIWCGDEFIGHLSQHGEVRYALEEKAEAGVAYLSKIEEIIADTYELFIQGQSLVQAYKKTDGYYTLTRINYGVDLENILAKCITFVKFKVVKKDVVTVTGPINERVLRPLLTHLKNSKIMPQIKKIREVQMAYFEPLTRKLRFNPIGYNPQTRTFTTGTEDRLRVISSKRFKDSQVALRWISMLTHQFSWANNLDRYLFIAATLSPCVADLLTEFREDGSSIIKTRPPSTFVTSDSVVGGAGKTIITKLTLMAAFGNVTPSVPETKDEASAIIGAKLEAMKPVVYFDECEKAIPKVLLTAMNDEASSRIKGFSREETGNIFVAMSAATHKLDTMALRRLIKITIRPKKDYKTRTYKNSMQPTSVEKYRPEMLWLVNSMLLTWHEAGCPLAKNVYHANKEYAELVGGIMEANQLPNPFNKEDIEANVEKMEDLDETKQCESPVLEFEDFVRHAEELGGFSGKPIEGEHKLKDLLIQAHSADLLPYIQEDAIGVRSLSIQLKHFTESNVQCCGYLISNKKKMDGLYLRFTKAGDGQSEKRRERLSKAVNKFKKSSKKVKK